MPCAGLREQISLSQTSLFRAPFVPAKLHPETAAGVAQAAGTNNALGRGGVSDNLSFASDTARTTGLTATGRAP